jgi:hypothetical protein
MSLSEQIVSLFLLAIPIACVSWTVTHEEVFSEPREFCKRKCGQGNHIVVRKFFYLFTCEYCFSHYVTIAMLTITNFRLLYGDWRGLLIAGFSLVWVANIYMSLFYRLRSTIKKDRLDILEKESDQQGAR